MLTQLRLKMSYWINVVSTMRIIFKYISAAVFIISGCINIGITDVTVQNTVGVGLALIENKNIRITNSTTDLVTLLQEEESSLYQVQLKMVNLI